MITEIKRPRAGHTRQKLLDAGLKLFARKGFSATTVGEIEAAAGLVPRRGGLYRHFSGKLALLDAAVSEHAAAVDQVALDLAAAPVGDPRTLTIMFAKWLLADMDRQKVMTQILEREGSRLAKARNRFRVGADAGFQAVAALLGHWAEARGMKWNARAAAAVLMGAVVNFRRSDWTMGKPPLGLTDAEFVEGLADLVAAIFRPKLLD